MIRTIAEMQAALRSRRFLGIVLYEGSSLLDGAPIAAIVNRIETASTNAKTGDMVQSFVMRSDIDPVTAARGGLDVSVCGDCLHRPAKQGTCYVNIGRAPLAVWHAYHRGRYARPGIDFDPALISALFAGMAFRIGTYGDPTAIPYRLWSRATRLAAAVNGYSHQWRQGRFWRFRRLCMASADTVADMRAAHAMGWRTFRVRAAHETVTPRVEVICPASAEAGHRTTCASCRACGGLSARAKTSIVIMAHGATGARHNRELAAA
jgi:hypothetical protein